MPGHLMLRITAPIFLGSFTLLALGVGTAWYVHGRQKEVSSRLAEDLASWRAAQRVTLTIRDIRTHLNRYVVLGAQQELTSVPPLYQQVMQWQQEGLRLARTTREAELARRVGWSASEFYAEYEELVAQASVPPPQEIRRLLDDKLVPEAWTLAHEYLGLTMETALQTSRQNEGVTQWMVLGLMLLGSCGAVGGLLAGYGIARGIRGSLVQLAVPIRDAAGKLDAVVGPVTVSTSQSFDELHRVLEQLANRVGQVVDRLNHSQRQALRAEQLAAVGQLAAGMAHELRNPLTAMKILVQSGNERPGGILRSRDLAVLEEEIGRLEKLVSTFLDFARPPQLEKRRLDLRTTVEPILTLVGTHAEQVGATVQVSAAAEPVWVEADANQMRQLVLNLLLNALDASRTGDHIEVEVARAPGDTAILRVSDTGCGLPADLGARIFEPFVSTKHTGLGLGLSICQRIVEAHGGTLTADNRAGGGAVFTVRLPAALLGLEESPARETQAALASDS